MWRFTERSIRWLLLSGIAGLIFLSAGQIPFAAEKKETARFSVRKAEEYTARQKSDEVTIAAELFRSDSQCQQVFGIKNMVSRGVLPVLVVVENGGKTAIEMDSRFIYLTLPESRQQPLEMPQLLGLLKQKSSSIPIPLPIPQISLSGANPYPLLESKLFDVKQIPPGQSDYGFVFYHMPRRDMWKQVRNLYLPRVINMVTHESLLYFEIPFLPLSESTS